MSRKMVPVMSIDSPTPWPATGWIDIHSHLIPGVDDGCVSLEDSLACITRLQQAGFVATICTPHVHPPEFPLNTVAHLRAAWEVLCHQLQQQGVQYRLALGCELRLTKDVDQWIQQHGVLTLAGSRCLLTDVWDKSWHKWVPGVMRRLMDLGYQPILAHPERLDATPELGKRLADLQAMGVWLQGNYRCMTGEEGYHPDRIVRQLLAEDRYRFLALDMHRPETLAGRLDGMSLVEAEFGLARVERCSALAPRRDVLGAAGT